jgi:hypothetical protein
MEVKVSKWIEMPLSPTSRDPKKSVRTTLRVLLGFTDLKQKLVGSTITKFRFSVFVTVSL